MRTKILCTLALVFNSLFAFAQNEDNKDKQVNRSPLSEKVDKLAVSAKAEWLDFQKKWLNDDLQSLDKQSTAAETLRQQLDADPDADQIDLQRTYIELETYSLLRERKTMQLEKIDAKIAQAPLADDRVEAIEKRNAEIDNRLRELRDFDRSLVDEKRLQSGSEWELEAKRAELVARLHVAESQLKVSGSSMKPSKRYALEAEIEELQASIQKYNERLREMNKSNKSKED